MRSRSGTGVPCTIEECISNACASTAVEAGMAGECVDGFVCSGEPDDECVECVDDAQCADLTPFCDSETHTCEPCESDFGGTPAPACPMERPVCLREGDRAGACAGADAGVPMQDAGTDAGPADAGGAGLDGGGPDAGSRAVDDGGCGCSLSRRVQTPAAWALILALLTVRRARKRKRVP